MNKKRYVLCFAHQIPYYLDQSIIFIERAKEDWQKNKLNLPGGSIYGGEPIEHAAQRELMEETGIWSNRDEVKILGEMEGEDWIVYICWCPYNETYRGVRQKPHTASTEGKILELGWRESMNDPRLIPNLKMIIPYCQAQISGWKMIPAADDHTWVTVLNAIPVKTPAEVAQL